MREVRKAKESDRESVTEEETEWRMMKMPIEEVEREKKKERERVREKEREGGSGALSLEGHFPAAPGRAASGCRSREAERMNNPTAERQNRGGASVSSDK